MTGIEISQLVTLGATDRARKIIKKLGISARLKLLRSCMPYVGSNKECYNFFKEHFSVEFGSLVVADEDIEKAEKIYRSSIK